ncbi:MULTISPECIES: hypothetical protein [unclassified Pseudomonas]|uniref:hypothetical protein n=1 Tax=unclassified Pseudomonas TaxID=196821 RepID=UPI002AB3811C|nr:MULTISPECIES: hypothetical protein [unclassified Pseudomonas]MDY7563466.1 hypothetical protein [Pseudomonas sp. AB6]MEA9979939.1 hypothetical protein [Pseudomonas sp. RTS4]MEB0198202.1 hypothetical protein [Pseudomonas sp. 5S4]MEB0213558.1 hypothetical protein [Pseudomonas sp. AB6]MEB0247809.1 hypothetical protein [Pseudomonas sp. 10S5]
MSFSEHAHSSVGEHIANQVANAVVHSSTNHVVGALMRGQGLLMIVVIAVALVGGVWFFKSRARSKKFEVE